MDRRIKGCCYLPTRALNPKPETCLPGPMNGDSKGITAGATSWIEVKVFSIMTPRICTAGRHNQSALIPTRSLVPEQCRPGTAYPRSMLRQQTDGDRAAQGSPKHNDVVAATRRYSLKISARTMYEDKLVQSISRQPSMAPADVRPVPQMVECCGCVELETPLAGGPLTFAVASIAAAPARLQLQHPASTQRPAQASNRKQVAAPDLGAIIEQSR